MTYVQRRETEKLLTSIRETRAHLSQLTNPDDEAERAALEALLADDRRKLSELTNEANKVSD